MTYPRQSVWDLNTYTDVAAEYYDAQRHPTCFNFGELSGRFIEFQFGKSAAEPKKILEVGAGKSTLAPLLGARAIPLSRLVLLDSSPAMLAYSKEWARDGAALVVANATATGFPNDSFDLIVASLGDPYNGVLFWQEVARLLQPHGHCWFTSPTFEWAHRFRERATLDFAQFLLEDGRVINLPSFVPTREQQLDLIREAGLSVVEIADLSKADLRHPASPKLDVFEGGLGPVVRGFSVAKSSSGN